MSVFLGPFIRAKNEPKATGFELRTCPNKDCVNHAKDHKELFCEKCGSKISLIQKEKTARTVDEWKVSEDIKEAFYVARLSNQNPFEDLWLPNQKRNRSREFHFNRHDHLIEENIDQATEIQWLKNNFAKEIEHLQKTYGPDNISLSWGIVAGDE